MNHFAGRSHKVLLGTDREEKCSRKENDQTEDQKIQCDSSGQRGLPEGAILSEVFSYFHIFHLNDKSAQVLFIDLLSAD
jgi:hypothetical protein